MQKYYDRKCEAFNCKEPARHIHHKDGNHKNNILDNLEYLCASHHKKAHFDDLSDNNIANHSFDLVDVLHQNKIGYRLTAGFNMLNDNELEQYDE